MKKVGWFERPVSVGLLDSTGSGGRLACSLGGQLLPGGLASGGLASGLLGTSHCGSSDVTDAGLCSAHSFMEVPRPVGALVMLGGKRCPRTKRANWCEMVGMT